MSSSQEEKGMRVLMQNEKIYEIVNNRGLDMEVQQEEKVNTERMEIMKYLGSVRTLNPGNMKEHTANSENIIKCDLNNVNLNENENTDKTTSNEIIEIIKDGVVLILDPQKKTVTARLVPSSVST